MYISSFNIIIVLYIKDIRMCNAEQAALTVQLIYKKLSLIQVLLSTG